MTSMPLFALLLLTGTWTVVVSIDTTGTCLPIDFKSYTHCIKKREAMHWCTAQGCKNNYHMTCEGFSCGTCPNGDCCNGTNCNVCHSTFCCSVPSCNYCIRACRHACANDTACQNICNPQCQTVTHDVFIVPLNSQVSDKPDVLVYIKGQPHKGNITSGQIPTRNKTAIVSIDGVDQPATILMAFPIGPGKLCQTPCNMTSCPGTVPNSPIQNCSLNCTKDCPKLEYNKEQNTTQNYYNLQPGCCHVVHPQQCYTNHIYPYRHCSARSHNECSNLCTSRFVHLTPQPRQQAQCHYIRNYPYIYCGQHSVQNCDSCYTCNGQYNPNFCARQNSCSNVCKRNFLPPDSSRVQVRSSWPGFQQMQTAESHKRFVYPRSSVYQPYPRYQPVQNMQFGRPLQYG